jgi:lipopolysaccharide transport system ATP-binding protein
MKALVEFDHVTKEFVLRSTHSRSLRWSLIQLATLGLGNPRTPRETFVALQDASFRIHPGETLGVIGENGSGKSTILKLVTRIIVPTAGRVHVEGRVAALLELGAGFHPELTGRENIFLNGSIMGMSQRQIERRLEEIISFTEIEPFIDMPVKHYSSGMYMRLGFAVAVHVEPQLLLVDEVLAVGDLNFQRKCLERIYQLRAEGVTVVLVSHDLDTVRKLCSRVLWLEHGRVNALGPTAEVVDAYLTYMLARQQAQEPAADLKRFGSREAEILRVEFCNAAGVPQTEFRTGETLVARIHYRAHERIVRPVFGIAIFTATGIHLTGPNSAFSGFHIPQIEGEGSVDAAIEHLPLLGGNYVLTASIYDESRIHPFDSHERSYGFRVLPGAVSDQYGVLHLPVRWRMASNGHP